MRVLEAFILRVLLSVCWGCIARGYCPYLKYCEVPRPGDADCRTCSILVFWLLVLRTPASAAVVYLLSPTACTAPWGPWGAMAIGTQPPIDEASVCLLIVIESWYDSWTGAISQHLSPQQVNRPPRTRHDVQNGMTITAATRGCTAAASINVSAPYVRETAVPANKLFNT